MKNKKKIITVAVLVAVLAVVMGMNVLGGSSPVLASYTEIYPTELSNSISVKGTVESIEKRNVYTTLGLTIKTVNVEAGDSVTAGQVLCEMDTEELELDIAQKKANLSVTQQSSLNQLQNSQRIYNEAASNLNSGTNNQIVNADASFENAKISLENAQRDYDNALEDYQNNTDAQITTAESNLTSAGLDLETKRTAYESNKALYGAGGASKDELTSSEDTYINAQNKYNDAVTSLENAKASQSRSLEQLENALKAARVNYDNAAASKNSAVSNAKQDLESYQSNVTSSQISMNSDSELISIQKLEKQLEDSKVKAPVSGTVTAVYAKEGATGSGLLFIIEDTDNLKISTTIKEYDVGSVKPGMPVTIKSDSTGDAVYEGIVSKINPAAVKNSGGETDSTKDIEFGSEIEVTSKNTDLKIGLTARLTIVLENKEGVYSVPYDAVAKDENGDSVVYVAVQNDQNSYTAKKTAVTTGLETDFYTEISGDGLSDGAKIINDASNMEDGMLVTLN